MTAIRRAIVCGKSVLLAAIETLLAAQSDFVVERLHPCLPDVVERILSRQPDIVLVEQDETHNLCMSGSALVLEMLHHDVPLIEVNVQRTSFRVIAGFPVNIANVDDLVEASEICICLAQTMRQGRSQYHTVEDRNSNRESREFALIP